MASHITPPLIEAKTTIIFNKDKNTPIFIYIEDLPKLIMTYENIVVRFIKTPPRQRILNIIPTEDHFQVNKIITNSDDTKEMTIIIGIFKKAESRNSFLNDYQKLHM